MSDTPSSSDRRSEIRTSRIFALIATVAGLFLSVSGILLCSANIEYGDVVALAGIALLAAGGVYGFALSRRLERIVARGVGLRRREETRKLEEIRDAHWQLSDSALRYRQLVDAQRDFVVRRSLDGRLVFANAAFLDAFDVRREDVAGSMFRPPSSERSLSSNPPPQAGASLSLSGRATASAGSPGMRTRCGATTAKSRFKVSDAM